MSLDVARRAPAVALSLLLSALLSSCATETPDSPPAGGEAAGSAAASGTLTHGGFAGYNVVLVSFDAVRADHTSVYGYDRPTTPALDELAEGSFVFDRCVAASSWTVPSTMSIFTGLWPSVHQVLNKYTIAGPVTMVPTRLNPAIQTIPAYLGRQGYRLAGFTGDAGANGRFGYDRGFETYLDDVKFGGFDHSVPAAQQWLADNPDAQFFLWLHGYDAHGQYDPADGYRKVFVGDYDGAMQGGKLEQGELRERGLAAKFDGGADEAVLHLDQADFDFHAALYDEKIQDADARFARFLDTLDERGLRDHTIIVVTADHGEEFGDHGYLDHGPTLYQELVHVPLIVYLPGIEGVRIDQQVRNVDILVTIADLLGQDLPFLTHGTSLLPMINGQQQPLTAFAETDYRLFTHKRAIVDAAGQYKLIWTLESGKKELYDLRKDPGETENLIESQARVAYELEQELVRWMMSMNQDPESYRDRQEEMIREY